MKEKRNISGIYFRVQNKQTGEWDTIVFEDLSDDQQDRVMLKRSNEWLQSLAKQLANSLREVSDKFDLVRSWEEN